MKNLLLAVSAVGLVTSVGLDARSTCAALRCRLNNFVEVDVLDHDNEPLVGAPVPIADFEQSDVAKLADMAAAAIAEALAERPDIALPNIPVIFCLAEPGRAGRIRNLETSFIKAAESHFNRPFHTASHIIAAGKSAVAIAMQSAGSLLADGSFPAVLIVAADTYLNYETVAANLGQDRMMATGVRAGFIPSEAAGALLVTRPSSHTDVELVVFAVKGTEEQATFSAALPLRADGLTAAIKGAAKTADVRPQDLAICVSDVSGEDYYFEELALAEQRTRMEAELWLPAESLGETGSVIGCIQIAWLLDARRQFYLPGNSAVLLTSDDRGQRTAAILAFQYSSAYSSAAIARDNVNELIRLGAVDVT